MAFGIAYLMVMLLHALRKKFVLGKIHTFLVWHKVAFTLKFAIQFANASHDLPVSYGLFGSLEKEEKGGE